MGPFFVRSSGKKVKAWIVCFTCTWSRAINLKVCMDLSVKEYLRAFQLHTFEFGLPNLCISDQGSQLVAGGNVILDYLKDPEVKLYLEENGIKNLQFEQFFKGNSALGSMVESCVKLTKRCLFGAMRNNVLDIRDFEFLICQTVHLLNRRPIAFKEALRDTDINKSLPDPITPECLIRGYDLVSVNLIPELQRHPGLELDEDYLVSPCDKVKENYTKLRKVRSHLINIYHEEFLGNLTNQAVNAKDRFKPVKHTLLQKNDVVLIKEPYSKPNQYPMGIVHDVVLNELGEVTGVTLLKGRTGELTKRHSSNLIFLFRPDVSSNEDKDSPNYDSNVSNLANNRILGKRKAAKISALKTRQILQ
ncbi:uncharacterized protein [Palaemon carinicauda]|uniref:uncharacterized protein n=1 Tax=Palaemon carinicauda TaxID=392227 RepID=UPI0035B68802